MMAITTFFRNIVGGLSECEDSHASQVRCESPEPTAVSAPRGEVCGIVSIWCTGWLCCPLAPLLLAGLLSVSGCASRTPSEPLPVQPAPEFSPSGRASVPDLWWKAFNDQPLNQRIDRALSENFSLTAAWERILQARAIARQQRSTLFPQLDGFVGAAISDGSEFEESMLSLGLAASYEVDVWGRIQSAVEAERLRATATAADYRAVAISLSAEVALAWYQLAEARQQIELIESQIETNETVLQVLERRFAVGQSGSADVLRQRQLVEATREQATVEQALVEIREHQLGVLEGRPPQTVTNVPVSGLPDMPPLPATGLPAELLQRRPDVVSALLQLRAADEDVASAVSDQYPRINLTASLETVAEDPSRLFRDWLASIAGQLVAPLFDAGGRRAEVERTIAFRRQLLAEYGQIVLDAFREVEDALAQEAYEAIRISSLEHQLDLARSTYRQLRLRYLNGAADYIEVLTALREQQALERSLLSARLDRLQFRIALYRALAGGFATPREGGDDILDTGPEEYLKGESVGE